MPKHAAAPTITETPLDLKSRLSAEISHLAELPKDQLRTAWAAEFRKSPPDGLSPDLLLRTLAWRLQEKAFGGHDAATLKLLKAFASQDADKVVLFRKLKPGTSVVREYQGVRHIVTITGSGFVWEGRTYSSLSAIALAITGAKWNGPRFFGLRDPNTGRPARKTS
jgi:Protein of unknown function (DUF2924)